jgi:hypothetical protein
MKNETIRNDFISQYLAGEADFLELAGLNHNLGVSFDGHQMFF